MNHQEAEVTATYPQSMGRLPWHVLWMAPLIKGLIFWATRNLGISLTDEGKGWYCASQVLYGAVPQRDVFCNYDPLRYYWNAGWSLILGSGLISFRASNALAGTAGLALASLFIGRVIRARFAQTWIFFFTAALGLWMFPGHKQFEHAAAIANVWLCFWVLERQTPKSYFRAGVGTGLIACVGRDLGLYALISLTVLIVGLELTMTRWKDSLSRVVHFCLGVVLGYAPMLVAMLFVQGFFARYQVVLSMPEGNRFLTLDIPWPWQSGSYSDWPRALLGWQFLFATSFYLATLVWAVRRPLKESAGRAWLASGLVEATTFHHAALRSDLFHFAQVVPPLLIGLAVLPGAIKGVRPRLIAFSFSVVSAVVLCPNAWLTQFTLFGQKLQGALVPIQAAGEILWVQPDQRSYIETISSWVRKNVTPGEGVFIAPTLPGLYPLLNIQCPVWVPYPIFPLSPELQREMVGDLRKNHVVWALISTIALDGREDRTFSRNSPFVWSYLEENYQDVTPTDAPVGHRFLRLKAF